MLSTNWTIVYAFNAFLYLGLSVFSIALLFGAWLWPLRVVGCIGHSCGCLAHTVAIVMTGLFLYNDVGEECASREIPYNTDGDTFMEDAELL